MAKTAQRQSKTYMILTIILGVLVVAGIVVIAVLASQNSKTKATLTDTEQQLASAKSQVTSLQSNLSSTQSQLTAAQAKSTQLQNDLTAAKAAADTQIAALQKDV